MVAFGGVLLTIVPCSRFAEISMYAVAQKEDKGLDKAVEECKYRMKRYGVQPNMLVIPPQENACALEPSFRPPRSSYARLLTLRHLLLAVGPLHVAGSRREDHVRATP